MRGGSERRLQDFFLLLACGAWIMVGMTEGSVHNQCARIGGVNTHKGAWISSRRARVPKERLKGSCADMGGDS